MENFKAIGDSRQYEVSDLGRVRNLETGYIFTLQFDTNGYAAVSLRGDVNKRHSVHRLVAEAFLPNPDRKRTVNHINGVKTDNRLENLEWATHSENNQHSYDTGLKAYRPLHYKGKFGAEHNRSIAIEQVDEFGLVVGRFSGMSEASRATGLPINSISWACNNHGMNRKTRCFFRLAFKMGIF